MSVSSELHPSVIIRQQIIDAALVSIERAKRDRSILSLSDECARLAVKYPNSGLTNKGLRELVATLAVDRGVNIAFG
jgi:hypothetical protein